MPPTRKSYKHQNDLGIKSINLHFNSPNPDRSLCLLSFAEAKGVHYEIQKLNANVWVLFKVLHVTSCPWYHKTPTLYKLF